EEEYVADAAPPCPRRRPWSRGCVGNAAAPPRWGEPGTAYESEWYCHRCWDAWDWDCSAAPAAAAPEDEAQLPCQGSLAQALRRYSSDSSVSLLGLRGLSPRCRRFLAAPAPHGAPRAADCGSRGRGMCALRVAEGLEPRILALRAELLPQLLPQLLSEGPAGTGGTGAGGGGGEAGVGALAEALASSRSFARFWVGPERGPFLLPALRCVKQSLPLEDVVSGLAEAARPGRRKHYESALTLTDGLDFRCPVALPPIGTLAQLMEVLNYGTVFLNTASLHWKSLAQICLAASRALHFPTNINVYVTGGGRAISTDVHTDNHDVLILQTEGAKRWTVYPPPQRAPGKAHPLYRGKEEDRLLASELAEPLLEVVLRPGEVLFIPMGFPHATSTQMPEPATQPDAVAADADGSVSVHLTLGISAADHDFCLGGLRRSLLERLGEGAALDEPALADGAFWELWSPTPAGCLLPAALRSGVPQPAAKL
ncbi:unnamed protein product, partial [Prorocentrum cordatum]